jgi:hypothetical protein
MSSPLLRSEQDDLVLIPHTRPSSKARTHHPSLNCQRARRPALRLRSAQAPGPTKRSDASE